MYKRQVQPATGMIGDYIKVISSLIDRGYAYFAGGNVYFDTLSLIHIWPSSLERQCRAAGISACGPRPVNTSEYCLGARLGGGKLWSG